MALTVQSSPQWYVLSGNPVEFILSSDTVVQSNHKIHAEILINIYETAYGFVIWRTIGTEELPVINNAVKFDVSDYLKVNEKADFNIFDLFSKAILQHQELINYSVRFYETYNNDGIKYNYTGYHHLFPIQGGFSSTYLKNFLSDGKTFYNEYVVGLRKFLSWAPDKKLTWNQHDFLFFIHVESELYYRVIMYFNDDTNQQIDSSHFNYSPGRHFCFINTSYLANELDSYETENKKIKYYTVQLLNGYDLPASELKTYYVDRNKYNQGRQFIFHNSLGGYDIVHLKGISEQTNKIQRTIGYFQTQSDISFSEFTETFEAASGFLVNSYKSVKDAKRYITELFRSKEVYEVVGREIIPVIPATKKIDISRDNEFLYSFAFDYEYAYSDKYFAPLDTEQYLNPRIFYSDGIVTPEPAVPGQIATVDFDVMINEDRDISFELNWGADVGTTSIPATSLSGGVTASLQSQITIPGNVQGTRTLAITDSLGGRYYVDYEVGDLNALFNTGEPALFNDGEQAQFNGL